MAKNAQRIRDWKGLLHDDPNKRKIEVFLAMLLLSASMTFTQFGFIGVGTHGEYVGYLMGLLVPLTVVTLLLGKGGGSLFGLLAGAILFVHARIQPLDLYERYFVSVLNSCALFSLTGFFLGLGFAAILREKSKCAQTVAKHIVVCLVVSLVTSIQFIINVVLHYVLQVVINENMTELPTDMINAVYAMGNLEIQIALDALLMLGVALATEHIVSLHRKNAGHEGVRTFFRVQLFIVVSIVFCVVHAASFGAITVQSEGVAQEDMKDEATYVGGLIHSGPRNGQSEVISSYERSVVQGYHLETDGTVAVFKDGQVLYSNNPAYPEGATEEDIFGSNGANYIERVAESGQVLKMVYQSELTGGVFNRGADALRNGELGYMCAIKTGDYYVMSAMPSSLVFASRKTTMAWASILALALTCSVFLLASRLLARDVVGPIDRTNASLAQITAGDLDVVVTEDANVEFASLSEGINATVSALKGWIAEAEQRMEQELATAKAIQESALPRVFPPFPEIGAFDIFAAMDAAKEVGGDFFDYFLIDDRTLGFLIADVSGKGIPGALFMMAAKTEIENYLSTGMEPSKAIASANRRLCANNDAGMFVTVWAATLDWETGVLTYVNAGHNFPLLRRGANGSWEWLRKKCGLFLGTFETAKYRQETMTLEPGDELLLYTDGVNEAFDKQGNEYGNDRLEAFVNGHTNMHPRELVRSLRADVAHWSEGAEQSDDVTMLALEFGVAPEVTGTITVPATLDHLDDVMMLVSGELEQRLCPISEQRMVEMALEELFVNVCQYAYAQRETPGTVQVSYAYSTNPSAITVELRDQGVHFDPTRHQGWSASDLMADEETGGLGLYMVLSSMDDTAYIRDDDYNVMVFKKGW